MAQSCPTEILRDDLSDNFLQNSVRNFLDFLSFTYTENNFILKNNFRNRKITKIYNISKSIYFSKQFICTNNLEGFLFKKYFQERGAWN